MAVSQALATEALEDPASAGPWRSQDDHRQALLGRVPAPPNALIGREREVGAVCCLLARDDVRLVTLTGPGGVGKTRLALAVAADAAGREAAAVAFVPLAPIRDAALVPAAIADRLDVHETSGRSITADLIDRLQDDQFLLVLDNFEHILDAAPLVAELLLACPHLKVVTTSRRRLSLSGEHDVPIPPLAVADPRRPATVAELAEVPAIQLFVARAQAAAPSFTLTEANGPQIAEICQRLDGLPLAIELAAPRTQLLSPAALLSRLTNRLQLLTGGPRDVPERLQTMRQVIAWSYDLLDPATQTLLRQLAVFVGGFTIDAAEWVAGWQGETRVAGSQGGRVTGSTTPRHPDTLTPQNPPPITHHPDTLPPASDTLSVLDLLAALLDESLLQTTEQPDGERRFGMLETIREYGLERLAASGEEVAARDAHAACFLALAEQAEPELQDAAWEAWVDRLVVELPNLRSALSYWRDRGDGERAVRLAGALGLFWTLPTYVREGRAWLETVVALPGADRAPAPLAKTLNAIGFVAQWQNDYVGAREALDRALTIRRKLGDELGVAEVLGNLGNVALDTGDLDRAEKLLAESLPLYASNGKTFWVGETLILLGHTVRARGEYDRSVAYHEEAVATLRLLPGQNKLSEAWLSLGWAELLRGDPARSRAAYAEGLALAEAGEDRMRLGRGVCGAAGLAAAGGDPLRAARLFAAAAAQRDEEQIALKPTIQAEHDRLAASVRDALGDVGFTAAWADGRAMPLEDAVLEAKELFEPTITAGGSPSVSSPRTATTAASRLTPREQEILRLLVDGRSDKEIAAALGIGRHTVPNHVATIRGKLDAPSHTAAAAIDELHARLLAQLQLGLTTREVEVLGLVAAGQADKEIASALAISRHTASKHVAAVRAKLAAPSRTGAVAAARAAGLL